jgi:hypothetical protein
VAASLELRRWGWLGPAELRAESEWRAERDDGARHLPDLGMVDPSGRRTAIEVELQPKSRVRLQSILGGYRIEFRRDVSRCGYSAVLASVPGGTPPDPVAGRITVAGAGGAAVNVRTWDAAGAAAPQPFHLIVAC